MGVLLTLFSIRATAQGEDIQYLSMTFYHDLFATALGVESDLFKLYPGNASVGSTSMWMWNIFNAVSGSDGIFYDPAQYNNFSHNYGSVLYEMKAHGDTAKTCQLNQAIQKYSKSEVHAWDKTIDMLNKAMKAGVSIGFSMDTSFNYVSTVNGDTLKTTIKLSANYEHITVFQASPYSVKSSGIPDEYTPWFSTMTFTCAYTNPSQDFLTERDWDSFFGESGSMRNLCVALIVAESGSMSVEASNQHSRFQTSSTFSSPLLLAVLIYPVSDIFGMGN